MSDIQHPATFSAALERLQTSSSSSSSNSNHSNGHQRSLWSMAMSSKTLSVAMIGGVAGLWWWSGKADPKFRNSRFGIFLETLSALSMPVMAASILVTIKGQEAEHDLTQRQQSTESTQNTWMNPLIRLQETAAVVPAFTASLYPGDTELKQACAQSGEQCQQEMTRIVNCLGMFQAIDQFLIRRFYSLDDDIVHLARFLPWMQSIDVQHKWHLYRSQFRADAGLLIDLLITYAVHYAPSSTDDYPRVARLLIQDVRFQELLQRQNGAVGPWSESPS